MESIAAVAALAALAQDTRLAIFRMLVEAGPDGMPAGNIATSLGIAAPTLSFHLKELAHANLLAAEPRGRFIVYRADFNAMNELLGYLTENCCRGSVDCATVCDPAEAPVCTTTPHTSRRARAIEPAATTPRRKTT